MRRFAQLYKEIDSTTRVLPKVKALVDYFREAPDSEAIWVIALFTHRRPKRLISTTYLREWAIEISGLSPWLFEDSYHICGDLAETISLVLPPPSKYVSHPLSYYFQQMVNLRGAETEVIREWILDTWDSLPHQERFLFCKFITGGFRVGVSDKLLVRALGQAHDVEESDMAYKLMGDWTPMDTELKDLLADDHSTNIARPYPFYLAYALEKEAEDLGDPGEWSAEYKWDGIRSQLIKRAGEWFLWSRGEDLINESFPEFSGLLDLPDGTVIDGELIAHDPDHTDVTPHPSEFNALQKRLGRKKPGKKTLENYPVTIIAYDLLEWNGKDLRERAFAQRRELLKSLVIDQNNSLLRLSPIIEFNDWDTVRELRENARNYGAEGLMLKRLDSPYKVGRKKGDWWKYKVDPYTIDAVMTYAQSGHGRRSNLFTDFTFGLWEDGELITFAKAYSGLTDVQFREVSKFVRAHTLEKYGPVRKVKAELVMELAFEGVHLSSRHKSGVAVRFPRIKRWRKDKTAAEADQLSTLKALIGN